MAGMDSTFLELRGLAKSYGHRDAVRGISLSIRRGEILGLLGPNGAGKSTLIGMLSGFVSPSAGEILWDGQPVHARLAAWRRSLGVVLEDLSLFELLTVEENIRCVAGLAGLPEAEADRRRADLLAFLDLEAHADTPAIEASQGTRQKLAVGLALLCSPRLLLLDEALNGVDALTVSRLKALLRRLADGGVTVIVSSHVLDALETLVHRCVIVHQGRAVLDASLAALRESGRSLEQVYTSAVGGDQREPTWARP
jgi:ABC-2 type transport system ATP-binding protein